MSIKVPDPFPAGATSVSLLDRLKRAEPAATDWGRLQEIYLPLIARWLARVPGLGAEADDLAQEVFVVVVGEIPRFERQRQGSFRAWLRQVTVNRARTHRRRRRRAPAGLDRGDDFLDRLADPNDKLSHEWDLDHDRYVFQKLQTIVRPDFNDTTWQAFERFGVGGQTAAAVAAELGMTANAVIQAKARVLKRLRDEAGELLH